MTFEIYDRRTGEVVETHRSTDAKTFLTYWRSQCNKEDYGYRPVKEKPAAKPPRARKPTKARKKR